MPNMERDRAVLRRLPVTAYDACDKRPGRVSSLSLVRSRGTDYSVPTRFVHCEVLVRGSVHEVVISCGTEVIAYHPRSASYRVMHSYTGQWRTFTPAFTLVVQQSTLSTVSTHSRRGDIR